MARTRTKTLLPLDRYAVRMGLNQYHFNNLSDGNSTDAAKAYWRQPDHDELALYLSQSEARVRDGESDKLGLGFEIAPTFRQDRMTYAPNCTQWYTRDALRTLYGYVSGFGTQSLTLVEADATLSFSDDVGTVSVTGVSDIEESEAVVYYRVADGADTASNAGWQIRPLKALIDGTTLTISGHKALFVKPSVLLDTSESDTSKDASDSANFVTAVDIYQETINAELPLTIEWDALRLGESTDPTERFEMDGAALLQETRTGLFLPRPATYSSGTHAFADPTYTTKPDFVLADYQAGFPYEIANQRQIDARLETAVLRLANVMMPDLGLWLGDFAQRKWRDDRKGPSDENPLSPNELDNPFGFSVAARYVWMVIRHMQVERMPF